jgi:hypothetical protein
MTVEEGVVLDHAFAGENDVFGAQNGGAAGDFVACFGFYVVAAGGGFGWHYVLELCSE